MWLFFWWHIARVLGDRTSLTRHHFFRTMFQPFVFLRASPPTCCPIMVPLRLWSHSALLCVTLRYRVVRLRLVARGVRLPFRAFRERRGPSIHSKTKDGHFGGGKVVHVWVLGGLVDSQLSPFFLYSAFCILLSAFCILHSSLADARHAAARLPQFGGGQIHRRRTGPGRCT